MCLFHLASKTGAESVLFNRRLVAYVRACVRSNRTIDLREFIFPKIEINLNQANISGNARLDFTGAELNGTKLHLSRTKFQDTTLDFTAAVFSNGASVTFDEVQFVNTTIGLRKAQLIGKSNLDFRSSDFRGNSTVNAVKTIVTEGSRLGVAKSSFHDASQLYFNEASFYDGSRMDMDETVLNDQSKAVFPFTIFDEHSGIDLVRGTLNDDCEVDFPDTDLGVSSFMWTRIIGLARLTIGRSDQPIDLSKVSFLFADVSRMEFGNVVWGTHPRGSVAEESELGKHPFLSYVHVAELYRALRQNYENQLRFNEASDFFVREMELFRKKPRYWGALLNTEKSFRVSFARLLRRAASCFRSYFSIAEIYNLLAEYGESYSRALYWSVASILLIYPVLRFLRDGIPSYQAALSGRYLQSVESAVRIYFQVFALPNLDAIDVTFRLWSALLLATFFIAVRRKFERKSSLS